MPKQPREARLSFRFSDGTTEALPLSAVVEGFLRQWHALAQSSDPATKLARIFHRSRATNEYGIALVCPKIQVSNLDQRAGNAEAKLYRRN